MLSLIMNVKLNLLTVQLNPLNNNEREVKFTDSSTKSVKRGGKKAGLFKFKWRPSWVLFCSPQKSVINRMTTNGEIK